MSQNSNQETSRASARRVIDESWRRSQLCGVLPDRPLTLVQEDLVENDGRFVRAVQTVLDDSVQALEGNELAILVADSTGRIVRRWVGTDGSAAALDRIGAVAGADFSEERVGTNGLGTPIETRRQLDIHRDDHFVHALHSYSCFGMPVINPMTSRVEGVIDITSTDGSSNPLFQPYVAKLVHEVREELVAQSRVSEQRTFLSFREAVRRSGEGIAALCGDLSLANTRAAELLRELDSFVLQEMAAGLAPTERRTLEAQPGSGPPVRIVGQRIDGTVDGTLFEIEVRPHGVVPVAAAAPRGRTASVRGGARGTRGRSPTLHIVGEPGSGRTTEALTVAEGRPLVHLRCADAAVEGQAWLGGVLHHLATHDGVLLLDDIDLLPVGMANRLAASPLGRAELTLVMTSVPDLGADNGRLAALCADRSTLAPLRDRAHELDGVIADTLPGLTSAALDRLRSYPWPGNFTELARVLTTAAENTASALVTVDDLPTELRTPVAATTDSDRRDDEHRKQISAALLSTGGDKKAAARELGISRTTLYTRMRRLQIF